MTAPIRVLRLIPVLDFGGVESVFLTQARHWHSSDIDIEYLTFWKDGDIARQMRNIGAVVHTLDINPSIRNPRATLALGAFLRRAEPDIVHAAIGEANFHAMCCAPFGSWRTIIEEAGIPRRRLQNRLIHRALYTFTDQIVCVSQAGADNLMQREWAPASKIAVIHNPIDSFYFIQPNTRNPHRYLFRAIGRLTAVKNFDGLIRAFAAARTQVPSIRLEIIGDGEERHHLEQCIQTLGQQEAIQLLGFRDDIATLHEQTGWLLMPSHREGFGLVAAEAMAAGVPVLASGAGGLAEVLGDLASTWSIPATNTQEWTDRIVKLATTDAERYQQFSHQFRAQAARFRPERYVEKLEALYQNITITTR